jgi:hypothetical protein
MRELVTVAAQLLGEARVGDRDGSLVRQALEQRQLVGGEPMLALEGDGERADDAALRRAQRRGGEAAEVEPQGDRLVVLLVRDARVRKVVVGRDDLTEPRGQPVDAAVDRELERRQPFLGPRDRRR